MARSAGWHHLHDAELTPGDRTTARLWAVARGNHEEVRRSPFLTALAHRRLTWRAYADWLAQLYFLHDSLAQAAAVMPPDPVVASLGTCAGSCVPALSADLRFLLGAAWQHRIAAHPATTECCARVRDVGVRSLPRFTAALYGRHVEDLLTATEVRSTTAIAYGLDDAGGEFMDAGTMHGAAHLDRLRTAFNRAAWPMADVEDIAADIGRAHRAYLMVLHQLSRRWNSPGAARQR